MYFGNLVGHIGVEKLGNGITRGCVIGARIKRNEWSVLCSPRRRDCTILHICNSAYMNVVLYCF